MDYKKEVNRALFHMGLGISIVILALILEYKLLIYIMCAALVGGLIISAISRKTKLPVIDWFLRHFERPEAYKEFPGKGSFYFVAGSLITLLLFQKNTALAAIMVLAFGDGFTNIFGPFGKISTTLHSVKKVEGTIAGIFMGTVGAMVFVHPVQAFFGALLAMVAELIDFEYLQINDNILVPVIAGFVIHLFSFVL
ncbi:hypothetical protein KY311_00475 [Candidatus Woesearchaeota archaeon]|nr:hypothetical protein [Candidatus Woesearchaeota archaeon]